MDEQTYQALVKRLQEFTRLWEEFIHIFDRGLETEKPSEEDEIKFRKLQYEIVRRAQYLMLIMPEGVFGIYGDVIKLFRDSISLRILKTEPSIRINSLRSIWHESQISLNKMGGQLRTRMQDAETTKSKGFLSKLKRG